MTPTWKLILGGGLTAAMGLLSLSAAAAISPASTTPREPGPSWVIAQMKARNYPLPPPGRACVVLLVRRTTPTSRTPRKPASGPVDPFNDRIGILWTDEMGQHHYWHARGTAEPGWKPMWGLTEMSRASETVSRLHCPQFAVGAFGGGFHKWDEDRPAHRQVGDIQIDLFDRETARWRGPVISRGRDSGGRGAHNLHTTSKKWQTYRKTGVKDWSHGCPVVLNPDDHRRLLNYGGWTEDIDGVRLDLVVLPWTGATR